MAGQQVGHQCSRCTAAERAKAVRSLLQSPLPTISLCVRRQAVVTSAGLNPSASFPPPLQWIVNIMDKPIAKVRRRGCRCHCFFVPQKAWPRYRLLEWQWARGLGAKVVPEQSG